MSTATYALDLNWSAARALALAGAMVRRWAWTDRWLFWDGSALWWLYFPGTGASRVVQAADFTRTEFLAADFTTMYPDQASCISVPDPTPQPDAAGPVTRNYYLSLDIGSPGVGTFQRYGFQVIPNPFPVACTVQITGTCDDQLILNDINVMTGYAAGDFTVPPQSFVLQPGGSFSIAALDVFGNDAQYNLNVTFTP